MKVNLCWRQHRPASGGRGLSNRACATAGCTTGCALSAVADAGVASALINASRGGLLQAWDRVVGETTRQGTGFLAQLCVDWETAMTGAAGGARVVLARTGWIAVSGGGMLRRPLFSVGLGARLKRRPAIYVMDQPGGRVRALQFAIAQPSLSGR